MRAATMLRWHKCPERDAIRFCFQNGPRPKQLSAKSIKAIDKFVNNLSAESWDTIHDIVIIEKAMVRETMSFEKTIKDPSIEAGRLYTKYFYQTLLCRPYQFQSEWETIFGEDRAHFFMRRLSITVL